MRNANTQLERLVLFVGAASLVGMLAVPKPCLAIDQIGLTGEFSLPDRADSQDDYYGAIQRLQDADAAVVRARESAIKQLQSKPEYIAAVKDVDRTFQAFNEKKTAMVDDMAKKNPVYLQMKTQTSTLDAQIETARQNPATTPEQLSDLYKNRETFVHQWQQLENDSMDRAGITPLRQQWLDASKKLAEMQDKQRGEVEAVDRVKAALAMAEESRSAVQQARSAANGSPFSSEMGKNEQASTGDLLCKNGGGSFAGNDAWWTYGWSSVSSAGTTPATTSGKAK